MLLLLHGLATLRLFNVYALSTHVCLVNHLSPEPGRQSSRVGASKADPSVSVAQVEALANVLTEYS